VVDEGVGIVGWCLIDQEFASVEVIGFVFDSCLEFDQLERGDDRVC
jgi:hypothetical protein